MIQIDGELAFSNKYDRAMALRYFEKHQQGVWRRFKIWHEARMLRRILHAPTRSAGKK